MKVLSASFTRPADSTKYAIGDVICNSTSAPVALSWAYSATTKGSAGSVISAVLLDGANQQSKGSFEIWLFDNPITPAADNTAFAPTFTELQYLIGIIPLTVPYIANSASGSSGSVAFQIALDNPMPFRCPDTSDTIYGVLIARSTYTPVSNEVFTVRLGIIPA